MVSEELITNTTTDDKTTDDKTTDNDTKTDGDDNMISFDDKLKFLMDEEQTDSIIADIIDLLEPEAKNNIDDIHRQRTLHRNILKILFFQS